MSYTNKLFQLANETSYEARVKIGSIIFQSLFSKTYNYIERSESYSWNFDWVEYKGASQFKEYFIDHLYNELLKAIKIKPEIIHRTYEWNIGSGQFGFCMNNTPLKKIILFLMTEEDQVKRLELYNNYMNKQNEKKIIRMTKNNIKLEKERIKQEQEAQHKQNLLDYRASVWGYNKDWDKITAERILV